MEREKDILAVPHFRDYWFIIMKRRKVIIISVILLVLIALLGVREEEPLYEAKTKIIIDTGMAVMTSRGRIVQTYSAYRARGGKYENEYDVMRSPAIAKRVAEMLGWEGEDAVGYIRSSVQINPVRQGYTVTNTAHIVGRSKDPKEAMDMANFTVKSYIESKEDESKKKIKETYDIYSEQLEEVKRNLRDSEIDFNDFKKEHGIVGMGDVNLGEESAEILSNQLVEIRTRIYKLDSLLQSLKKFELKGDSSTGIGILASNYPEVINRTLYGEMGEREKELLGLLAVYTEKHPLVIQKRGQIEELAGALEQDMENAIANLSTTRNMLRAEEENIMYTLRLKDPELGPNKSEYYALKQEIYSNQTIYESLVREMKELDVSKEISMATDIKILEWAKLPRSPIKRKNIMILLAPFFGLFFGLSLTFFLEYMDNTIKTEMDVKRHLDLPILGIIPHLKEGIK